MDLDSRSSGVLLHLTSLPGGTLGPGARRFADFLHAAGQRWWQMLPVGIPDDCGSPYQSPSTFAGDPGLLAPGGDGTGLSRYRHGNRHWLPGFSLFRALKNRFDQAPWTEWPAPLRDRHPAAVAAARKSLRDEIRSHETLQYRFDRQWAALKKYCASRGVGLIGDLPIYVSGDSADAWSHPELFSFDAVAGVPPDYFSRTGQLWGNPLYRWNVMRRTSYRWWIARLRKMFERFDAVRLDHFIGFHRYWSVPAGSRTAEHGTYRKGPGAHFFGKVALPNIIAEDLGNLTPEVEALRDRFEFPGMRVLQFAFGTEGTAPMHLPQNHPKRCIVYTGTHDNNTTRGWFDEAPADEKRAALRHLGTDGRDIAWDFIRLAHGSVANLAMVPMQDLLGLDARGRMNLPGTVKRNWSWKMKGGDASPRLAAKLRELTILSGRA